jgi:pimeloyl-ACP methyl ester carboxylesterase
MAATTLARIDDLLLEHRLPSPRTHAEPILFVHGMSAGSWCFEHYLDAAAERGWECWAIDLRGRPGSRPVADLGRVSIADYVRDVVDALDEIGPAVVVGHSMGGLIAQVAAATRSEVRAAVFLASAAPRGIVVLRWPVLARMGRYLPAMLGSRPFRATDGHATALLLNRVAPSARAALLARLGPESGRVARELAFGAIAVDAARVSCPTLVVAASDDATTPASVQRRIAQKYGSEYVEAPGFGHMLLLEDGWEAPFGRVLAWLEQAMR